MWTYWYFKQNKRVLPTIALTANGSWVNQTPSIYPSIETSAFQNGTAYFYLTGTNGLPLISASAEL